MIMSPEPSPDVPRFPRWLLKRMAGFQGRHSAMEDFAESFDEIVRSDGERRARLWYWTQVLRTVPGYGRFVLVWSVVMFGNYLKIAIRNLGRNRTYTFITACGLAVAMTCALYIFVFAEFEWSHDRFHDDADTIYQVLTQTDVKDNPVTPTALAPFLRENFPEIVEAARYHWFWGENIVQHDQRMYTENRVSLVDPAFFTIFNFPFVEGNPETALADPNSIVMTRETAKKYFGDEGPIGQTVTLNHEYPLTVTGVMADIPRNSSLRFDMVLPMQFNIVNQGEWYMDWNNLFVFTFVKCRENSNIDELSAKIAGIASERGGTERLSFSLLPFAERYFFFYSEKSTVIVFLAIAVFILLIAAFNFVNLTTALAGRRAREIGMRKILGAPRKQIMTQQLGESILLAFTAAVFALLMFSLFLPLFQSIVGLEIEIRMAFVVFSALAVALFTGVAAGLYPAFFLSAFRIVQALRGRDPSGLRRGLRKGIVVAQFMMSILLLLGMLVVQEQIRFIRGKDLGYGKENIVSVPMGGGSEKHYEIFRHELGAVPGVMRVTGTKVALPYFGWRISGFDWEGRDSDKTISINFNEIDYDFVDTTGIALVAGRDMSRERATEAGSGIFVNEKMAALMGLDPVVGATVRLGDDDPLQVIGIVEDFHFSSLYNEIGPLVLRLDPHQVGHVLIRIRPESRTETMARIEDAWKRTVRGYPFQFSFLDQAADPALDVLRRISYLLAAFAVTAVVISCLGLFGLSTFMARQSTREIGIRKVHGATVASIVRQFSVRFIVLVIIADVVAFPLAYVLTEWWLSQFAYRTPVQLSLYLITGIVSVLIVFLSVGFQFFKAARTDPALVLRHE
jgi:ABC-type antimicrobial peptide transport system permease subunit